jgi:hypothetical protein
MPTLFGLFGMDPLLRAREIIGERMLKRWLTTTKVRAKTESR